MTKISRHDDSRFKSAFSPPPPPPQLGIKPRVLRLLGKHCSTGYIPNFYISYLQCLSLQGVIFETCLLPQRSGSTVLHTHTFICRLSFHTDVLNPMGFFCVSAWGRDLGKRFPWYPFCFVSAQVSAFAFLSHLWICIFPIQASSLWFWSPRHEDMLSPRGFCSLAFWTYQQVLTARVDALGLHLCLCVSLSGMFSQVYYRDRGLHLTLIEWCLRSLYSPNLLSFFYNNIEYLYIKNSCVHYKKSSNKDNFVNLLSSL